MEEEVEEDDDEEEGKEEEDDDDNEESETSSGLNDRVTEGASKVREGERGAGCRVAPEDIFSQFLQIYAA